MVDGAITVAQMNEAQTEDCTKNINGLDIQPLATRKENITKAKHIKYTNRCDKEKQHAHII